MNRPYRLTELQLALLRVLWRRGEATVLDVRDELAPERELAQTTVATLSSRLEKRGLVTHGTEGRQYVYRARVTEPEVRRSMVTEFSELGGAALLTARLVRDEALDVVGDFVIGDLDIDTVGDPR